MKILHLIWDDVENPWIGGGGAVRTHEIYKRLAADHEITVLTGNYPRLRHEPSSGVVKRDNVLYKRIGWGKSHLLSLITYSLSAPFHIRKHNFDLVIEDFCAHSPVFAPMFTRKPVLALLQNLFETQAIKKHGLLGILIYLFERYGLRFYRNFIATTPYIESKIKQEISPEPRIICIRNATADSLFLRSPVEKDYVLFLGRLEVYQKGLDTLMNAFKSVSEKYPSIKLKLAGSVNKRNKKKLFSIIEDLRLSNQIEFVGTVSGEKKANLISQCLFVCMPSRYESWPLVAMEAAACQKPVIGSDIPGIRDAVKAEETGILVDTNSPEELSKAMIRLIKDVPLQRRLGRNARQWARNLTWDKQALLQEKFYIEILGHFKKEQT